MTMSIVSSDLIYTATVILTVLHLLPLAPASCVDPQRPLLPPRAQGLLTEEKTRLGSTPPSCHNKCNECHPCIAVQVPTVPGHNRVKPGFWRKIPMELESYPSTTGIKYANYKPLGWKCRCGNRLFNP
uniref:Epidermal patterning factor-like protein n=1 Tax=Nelumbo nucifera TaxID=4432 RepID=A0A822XSC9_NELNU|nr:TPA_asm: hypothetical protein HUJ06_023452 [Nelumbo nucifera]